MGFAGTDNCTPEEKGSVTEDSGIDLDFSECERMDKLNQTISEILAYDTNVVDMQSRRLTFTCLETTGKHI